MFWPYMAVVDGFQHWAYTNPEDAINPANCDAQWTKLWKRFQTFDDLDSTGFEDIIATGWHNKLHLFHVPFYYIEYGMAQLGAIAVWRNYKQNPTKALQQYKDALALGYTKTISEIYEAAGIKFDFSKSYVKELAGFVKGELRKL